MYRQHSVNSDINTPLNSIPFPSAQEGHVSELNFSGRQSRLSVLAEAKPSPTATLQAYYEMDFLGTGTSSNNNQSNSYVLRQRQIWGRYMSTSGFAVTGGQMWSLVTEDRKGTDAPHRDPAADDRPAVRGGLQLDASAGHPPAAALRRPVEERVDRGGGR